MPIEPSATLACEPVDLVSQVMLERGTSEHNTIEARWPERPHVQMDHGYSMPHFHLNHNVRQESYTCPLCMAGFTLPSPHGRSWCIHVLHVVGRRQLRMMGITERKQVLNNKRGMRTTYRRSAVVLILA